MIWVKLLFILLFSLNQTLLAGSIKENLAWSKNNIEVCWWNSQTSHSGLKEIDLYLDQILNTTDFEAVFISQRKKNIISKFINRHFTQQMTGIYFTGWKDCIHQGSADVILYGISKFKKLTNIEPILVNRYEEETVGRASLGERINKDKPSFGIFLISGGINTEEKMTFLHEFSHIAGLVHEHNRAEALKDPRCLIDPVVNKKVLESVHSYQSAEFTSIYDPFSITNYCFESTFRFLNEALIFDYARVQPDPMSNDFITLTQLKELVGLSRLQISLSKGDLNALKCMYQYSRDLKSFYCHQDFKLDDQKLNQEYNEYLKLAL